MGAHHAVIRSPLPWPDPEWQTGEACASPELPLYWRHFGSEEEAAQALSPLLPFLDPDGYALLTRGLPACHLGGLRPGDGRAAATWLGARREAQAGVTAPVTVTLSAGAMQALDEQRQVLLRLAHGQPVTGAERGSLAGLLDLLGQLPVEAGERPAPLRLRGHG